MHVQSVIDISAETLGELALDAINSGVDARLIDEYRSLIVESARLITRDHQRYYLVGALGSSLGALGSALVIASARKAVNLKSVKRRFASTTRGLGVAKLNYATATALVGYEIGAELYSAFTPTTSPIGELSGLLFGAAIASRKSDRATVIIDVPTLVCIIGVAYELTTVEQKSVANRILNAICYVAIRDKWSGDSLISVHLPRDTAEEISEVLMDVKHPGDSDLSSILLSRACAAAVDYTCVTVKLPKIGLRLASRSVAIARAMSAGSSTSVTDDLITIGRWATGHPQEARYALGVGWRVILWIVEMVGTMASAIGVRSPIYLDGYEDGSQARSDLEAVTCDDLQIARRVHLPPVVKSFRLNLGRIEIDDESERRLEDEDEEA